MSIELKCGDCLELMKAMPDNSVDLILGSPPYEAARTYGIDFKLKGQAWVDWMAERMIEMVRVSRGLVCMVLEGQTKDFQWSATPALLMADLHRAGINLRKPPIYHRIGVPGSGGKDWLKNNYEFCICCTSGGELPWSDNTACGHPPKWAPGGDPSHRMANGRRVHKLHTKGDADGKREQGYNPPKLANPGNTIQQMYTADEVDSLFNEAPEIVHCKVGGGLIGSKLAHENEAPFPEDLAKFFVLSFCPPGGTVLDPFNGSGTSVCVAKRTGRNGIGFDVRESQIELTRRRLEEVQPELIT